MMLMGEQNVYMKWSNFRRFYVGFLWTIFGINLLAAIAHFISLKDSKTIRTSVIGLLIDFGMVGWALYFIVSGAR